MTGLPIASGPRLNSLSSRIFTRGNFSPYIFVYISKMFHISTWIECRYVEYIFLIHSSYFCGHEYKIIFCNKLYISPYPKIATF